MKKILFLLPLAVLLAAGCNSSQQTYNQPPVVQNINPASTPAPTPTSTPTSSDWKTYKNPKYNFEIDYPETLSTREETDIRFQPPSFSAFFESAELHGYVLVNNPGMGTGFNIPVSSQQINAGGKSVTMELLDSPTNQEQAATISLTRNNNEIFILFRYNKKDSQQATTAKKILSSFQFTDSSTNWKTYTNKIYGFTVQIPNDYIVEDSSDQINIMPKSFQQNRRGAMLQISPINVGRESVFDKGNENLVSCKIIDATLGGKKTKLCTAKSIYGYSYYSRVIDLTGTKWGKDNEISFSLNLEGEIQSQQELDSILGSYNKIISSLKFNN